MNENGQAKRIHETTVGNSGGVRAILEVSGDSRLLRVVSGSAKPQEFTIPESLTTTDLPIWMASALRKASPGLTEADLSLYEDRIRQALPSDREMISVLIGRREDLQVAPIFHFARKFLIPESRGSVLILRAQIEQPFIPPEFRNWIFTFFMPSVDATHALHLKFLQSKEAFFCLSGQINGIVASNIERWETTGFSRSVVEALAAERNVRLQYVGCDVGTSLAFRCE